MRYAARSVTGRRAQNQDSVFIPRGGEISLAIVADGMGGHSAGNVASAIAVETVTGELKKGGNSPPTAMLVNAINSANTAIYERSCSNVEYHGMGTTLVAALLFHSKFIVANVGDSRLYHFDGVTLDQVTRDHSYVAELVASGYITKKEAAKHPRRNLITRALGIHPNERVDVFERTWREGDILVLCSDGLYSELEDEEMARVLSRNIDDIDAACEDLLDMALESGSTDNISIVLVKNEEVR